LFSFDITNGTFQSKV